MFATCGMLLSLFCPAAAAAALTFYFAAAAARPAFMATKPAPRGLPKPNTKGWQKLMEILARAKSWQILAKGNL